MKTAVGAPAQWQDIIDTLDTMTPDQLRELAREILARLERLDPPKLLVLGEQMWPEKTALQVVPDA